MIDAGFFFPTYAKHALLKEFLALPGDLCPTHMSVGEDERGSAISNAPESFEKFERYQDGFFLKNRCCSYNISLFEKHPIRCSCCLDLEGPQARILLIRLAAAKPLFGFACLPEEREAKNRVVNQVGMNTIVSWVGRSIDKALPGLYWCTLVPEALARKHHIPISALAAVALEHLHLDGAQHFFRFYERPEDWKTAEDVAALSSSLPGIFDVEQARACMAKAKTFKEHVEMSRPWVG